MTSCDKLAASHAGHDRTLPAFTEIIRRAETRHRRAIISFLSAEGDRVPGVPYPV